VLDPRAEPPQVVGKDDLSGWWTLTEQLLEPCGGPLARLSGERRIRRRRAPADAARLRRPGRRPGAAGSGGRGEDEECAAHAPAPGHVGLASGSVPVGANPAARGTRELLALQRRRRTAQVQRRSSRLA